MNFYSEMMFNMGELIGEECHKNLYSVVLKKISEEDQTVIVLRTNNAVTTILSTLPVFLI